MNQYCMNCMHKLENAEQCPYCGYSGENRTVPHRLKPGTVLDGRYLIGNALGQGGFGITYIGVDLKIDARVAVKEYYPSSYTNRNVDVSPEITIADKKDKAFIDAGIKRFLDEARALGKFQENPGVVGVRDFFEENRTAYIVMEYLEGQDLRSYLTKHRFKADEIFRLMTPVMETLEKIHREHVIHRDISPDNIMLLTNGTAKLMDFGAAKLVDYEDQKSKSIVLKAGYAPEEQYRQKGQLGPWTDIYALCATIYKCITGITPDEAPDRVHKDDLVWPSEMGIEITALQEKVLKKGMEVRQENRFQNVRELMEMLGTSSVIHSVEFERSNDGMNDGDEDKTEYFERRSDSEPEGKKTECLEDRKIENKAENETDDKQENLEENREPGAGGSEKTGGKKLAPVIGIGLAACVLAAAFGLSGKNAEVGGSEPAAVSGIGAGTETGTAAEADSETGAETDLTEEAVFDPADVGINEGYCHITLAATDEMTVKGYNESLAVIKERIRVLTNGEPFGWKVNEDLVELAIPEWAMGEKSARELLQCYISRPVEFYMFDFISKDKVKIERADLEHVECGNGPVEGLDPAQYEIKDSNYEYIQVVLTEEFAAEHEELIRTWGENLRFGQDMERNSNDVWYYPDIFSAGDGRTFYILDTTESGKAAQTYLNELLAWNLTHDLLEGNFTFWYNLNEGVEWQDPAADTGVRPGENQKNYQDVDGQTVTVRMKSYYTEEELTAGEMVDMEDMIKQRLDALDQPYALGFYTDRDNIGFAFKTGIDHIGYPVWDMIGRNETPYLQIGPIVQYVSLDGGLETQVQEDGTCQVIANYRSKYSTDLIKEMTERAGAEADETALWWKQIPYLKGSLSDAVFSETENGTEIRMVFDELYYSDSETIGGEDLWFVDLLNLSTAETYLKPTFTLDNWRVNDTDTDEYLTWYELPVSDKAHLDNVTEQILTIDPDMEVFDNGTSTLYVKPYMELDGDFPEKALELAQQVYEASDFENSRYNTLTIYFIEEDDSVSELSRIRFDRHDLWGSGDRSRIRVSGSFYNGRMETYKEEIQKLIGSEPFYSGFEKAEWNFELPEL